MNSVNIQQHHSKSYVRKVPFHGTSLTCFFHSAAVPPLPIATGSLVSCAPGPLRVPSLRPYFNARLRLANGLRIILTWLCRLSPDGKALYKTLSARGLRTPDLPLPGAFARTRDTRKDCTDLYTKWIGGQCVVILLAFFGAPPAHSMRSAYPFAHGCLTGAAVRSWSFHGECC